MQPIKDFTLHMIAMLESYDKQKKEEGFVPTVEMLVEDLKAGFLSKLSK